MENIKPDTAELRNYVRIRAPDNKKMAELLVRAKGASRSMRQFALECGVNPSTLSRIVNLKISGACTDELIYKVAKKAAPGSGVTFEVLMDANGKVPKKMTGKFTSQEIIIKERAITDVLFREMIRRGYALYQPQDQLNHNALNYQYRTDWAVLTNANSENDEMELWEFEIWHTVEGSSIGYTVMKLRQKFLMVLGLYYMGSMSPRKMSFVLTDPEIFERIIEALNNVKFNDIFSIILVNLETEKVDQEYVFPVIGKPNISTSFPPIEEDSDADDETEEELEQETEISWENKLFDI